MHRFFKAGAPHIQAFSPIKTKSAHKKSTDGAVENHFSWSISSEMRRFGFFLLPLQKH